MTNMELRLKALEEKLREAACYGDDDGVRTLVDQNVNINSQHEINGWTALHWAAKRGHLKVVKFLLAKGADPLIISSKGDSPAMVATSEEIKKLLTNGPCDLENRGSLPTLPIVPHYITSPPLCCNVSDTVAHSTVSGPDKELVLKVRTAYSDDPDFIEIELSRHDLTFSNLLHTCCHELGIDNKKVVKVRKLPNTILRKDKDVARLVDFQELEIVVSNVSPKSPSVIKTSNSLPTGYVTFSQNPFTTQGGLIGKSSYCINGTILY